MALTVWVFMDLAPVGRSGLQCSQTKPLQQDPDTLKQKGEQQKERNAGRGGDKVTRGEKNGEGAGEGNGKKVSVAAPIHPRPQV